MRVDQVPVRGNGGGYSAVKKTMQSHLQHDTCIRASCLLLLPVLSLLRGLATAVAAEPECWVSVALQQ